MATSVEYVEFVCEQIRFFNVRYKKMFGEYVVYVNDKPVLLVCDNTVFVKKLPQVAPLLQNADCGFPYDGAKEHFVLDIENADLVQQVVAVLESVTPVPQKNKKKN
ncbi:MAG: TfoX/Sxy family protein [Candidatus Fimimonas sp.]